MHLGTRANGRRANRKNWRPRAGHIHRREYLRDPAAGLSGQLIDSVWIEAAIGAAERFKLQPTGKTIAALDVADGGSDANALAVRHGCRLSFLEMRHDLRADEAGSWALAIAAERHCDELRYDAIGVGAGAAASLRRKPRRGQAEADAKPKEPEIIAWSGADKVLYPRQPWDGSDGRSNADMFLNLNAQSWWHLRQTTKDRSCKDVLGSSLPCGLHFAGARGAHCPIER
jgi:phage terminase large subunit